MFNFCSQTVIGVSCGGRELITESKKFVAKWKKFSAVSVSVAVAIAIESCIGKRILCIRIYYNSNGNDNNNKSRKIPWLRCISPESDANPFEVVFVFVPLIAAAIRQPFLNLSCITKLLELSEATHFPDILFSLLLLLWINHRIDILFILFHWNLVFTTNKIDYRSIADCSLF